MDEPCELPRKCPRSHVIPRTTRQNNQKNIDSKYNVAILVSIVCTHRVFNTTQAAKEEITNKYEQTADRKNRPRRHFWRRPPRRTIIIT